MSFVDVWIVGWDIAYPVFGAVAVRCLTVPFFMADVEAELTVSSEATFIVGIIVVPAPVALWLVMGWFLLPGVFKDGQSITDLSGS
jgi:hypothetical protein